MNNTEKALIEKLKSIISKAGIKSEYISINGDGFGIRTFEPSKLIEFLTEMGATELQQIKTVDAGTIVCGRI